VDVAAVPLFLGGLALVFYVVVVVVVVFTSSK